MLTVRKRNKGAERREFEADGAVFVYEKPSREVVQTYRRRLFGQFGGLAVDAEPVRDFLRVTLRDIRGVVDEDGAPLAFTRKMLDEIELPPSTAEKVANHIANEVDSLTLAIEQEKNESPASSDGATGTREQSPDAP